MKEEQLMLFYEPTEQRLEREVNLLRKEVGKVRRSSFARTAELTRAYLETRYELETLKKAMQRKDHEM